jgi:hypothetical protein
MMTQEQRDSLTDEDFEIYWHVGRDMTWCALCGSAIFPCEGYQLRLAGPPSTRKALNVSARTAVALVRCRMRRT